MSEVLRTQTIPISKPWLGEPEARAAGRAILSGWVTQGPEVAEFEREFSRAVGARHACAVSNGTTALHLALLAAGVRPGDEVITVSHSFIATANAVRYCGATPVFVDIEPGSYNLDPDLIDAVVTPRTRALIAVHQIGLPCDMPRVIAAVGGRFPVIEDAACAVGSALRPEDRWEPVGKPHGDAACFSFHPRKVLTTGEGGMITTNREDWDRSFRLSRQHGMTVADTTRHGSPVVIFESYESLGYNARMSDIQAAVGREQLKRLPEIVDRRRLLADRYTKRLADIPGLVRPFEPAWARTNWQSYCVRLPEECDQKAVMQAMLDAGVATRRGVMCAHREPSYCGAAWKCFHSRDGTCDRECPRRSCRRLTESERAQDRCILLPMFHELTEPEQDRVAASLRDACNGRVRRPSTRG